MNRTNDEAPVGADPQGIQAAPASAAPTAPAAAPPVSFMLADLARSGLDAEDAKRLHLRETPDGYQIPFLEPDTGKPMLTSEGKPFVRIRLRVPRGSQKYTTPPRGGIRCYILPEVHQYLTADQTAPIFVTEGEKKSACAAKAGLFIIGLPGIWGWLASRSDRDAGDFSINGDLQRYLHRGRQVVIVFDSDAIDPRKANDFDQCARCFAQELQKLGCTLHRVNLPQLGEGKTGLDDYLLAKGAGALPDMLAERTVLVPPYLAGATAADIMQAVFEPPRWVIPGILAEGLAIMAGKSKLGKSWLALDWALAVAAGRPAMGVVPVEQGHVLYLALEDTERRLQGRLKALLAEGTAPRALTCWCSLPYADTAKNLVELDTWLTHHPDARLVVIDTLGKIRPRQRGQGDDYGDTYRFLGELQNIAKRHRVVLLVVHHTRKSQTEDAYDDILGTTALMGACDTVLVLRRGRGAMDAEMHVTGRDVDEQKLALSFDAGHWRLEGDANDLAMSDERRQILAVLREHPEGMSTAAVAKAIGKERSNIAHLMTKLVDEKRVDRIQGGKYTAVHTVHNSVSEAEKREWPPFTGIHNPCVQTPGAASSVNGVNACERTGYPSESSGSAHETALAVNAVSEVNGPELLDWSEVDRDVEGEGDAA